MFILYISVCKRQILLSITRPSGVENPEYTDIFPVLACSYSNYTKSESVVNSPIQVETSLKKSSS